MPWEEDSAGNPISGNGERLATRQEIDWPIDAAPFKIVPYGLGELGDWGEDINGDRFQRAMGQAGVRASIPFWYADPNIHDAMFNLNGLAHKVIFDVQASVTGSNQDLNRFPLYDELDDDSIEDFRRRLFFSPFGGPHSARSSLARTTFPVRRRPSIRNSIRVSTRSVTVCKTGSPRRPTKSPTTWPPFALGMHHRLQTKRGAPGEEHIVDWVTFDANATWFPNADRDNAGAAVGLLDYDFRWNIGDRTSILSDGYADTFGDGLKTASIGLLINRPARGNFYIGFRAADGVFVADVLNATVNYRMTDKWIGSASSSIDFGPAGNIGQTSRLHPHRRIAPGHAGCERRRIQRQRRRSLPRRTALPAQAAHHQQNRHRNRARRCLRSRISRAAGRRFVQSKPPCTSTLCINFARSSSRFMPTGYSLALAPANTARLFPVGRSFP